MSTHDWLSFGLKEALVEALINNEMKEPSIIQEESIPLLLEGRDVYARSQTGSGKTLAFLLPILNRIEAGESAMQALIMAPTQELAMQIVKVAQQFGEPVGVRVQQLIGGAALKRQLEGLKSKPHICIGTPGRIREILRQGKLKLGEVRTIVVDEADQMFELGSTAELEEILQSAPPGRQLAFFSATLPAEMERLTGRYMKEPSRIDIEPKQKVAETIKHGYVVCSDPRARFETALKLLRAMEPASALMFISDTDQIANWETKLQYEGYSSAALYGDADKLRRSQTLDRFRDGKIRVLIATDVAARGIDVQGLPLVINLEAPLETDRYIHRAGRTGRMGREGTVVTIVTPRELFIIEKLARRLAVPFEQKVLHSGKLVSPQELRKGPRHGEVEQRPAAELTEEERAAAIMQKAAARISGAARSKPKRKTNASGKQTAATPAAPQPLSAKAKAKAKAEREREKKNKGAPKWLKAKRSANEEPKG